MGRAPCCDKANVKKGPWSPEEDAKLKEYIEKYGTGNNWIALPQKAGLRRCGKSCRLRWLNYLRPNIKHGEFTDEEDRIICCLYANIGSRWSIIAAQLPGRTDNDIKNYWNTKLKKKLMAIANPLQQQQQYPCNKIKTPTTDMYHPILNQPPSSSLLSSVVSSSSPYNYYYAPPPLSSSTKTTTTTTLSFGGFDQTAAASPISAPSSSLLGNLTPATMCSSSPSFFQDGGYLSSPVQNYLMFGGAAADQPSCSSSDGSCNNTNQVNQDDQFGSSSNDQNKGNNDIFKKYFYNNYYNNYESIEEDQKNILGMDYNNAAATVGASSTGLAEKCGNMFLGGDVAPLTLSDSLDFGLEEIKLLISSNSGRDDSINVCTGNSFLFDENKTAAEESSGVMMYY